MKKRTILVTNDDGIHGAGLRPLVSELKKIGRVIAIVPDQERSGMSHSITLHKPLWIRKVDDDFYMTTGTPVDCVRFSILHMFKKKIDMVVSGINTGPNLGEDVIYSGTVAGAREGALLGKPSLAVSLSDLGNINFRDAAIFARHLAEKVFAQGIPDDIYLNVNYPKVKRGVEVTTLGKRVYDEKILTRRDPRGGTYFWLSGKILKSKFVKGTDTGAVDRGRVSITPLRIETANPAIYGETAKWLKDLS
ncbi:MAG: 5'/3'-nucleotidase SurE [Elusimicrobia bacterium HGW-Elusimicrobia-1]|jgi:5'-nucleotidase|nr:MAG: 5'/3'-nucleotidase SurE [Elusimicrobia bacterium HGW-Elusimicrobia-1]